MSSLFGVEKFKGLLLAASFAAAAEFLMGFLGSVISGCMLGEEALAGVSLVSPVMNGMIFLSALIGCGMGINYSIRMGRCDLRGAAEIFTQAVWTLLVFGLGAAALMAVGRETFFGYLNPSAVVAAHARAYWNWFIPVTVLEPLAVLLLNVCYTDGDARLCYVSYGVQLLVNLVASILLLKAGYGTAGCAMGAVLGFAASAVVLSLHFFHVSNSFRLVRHFSWRDTWTICTSSFGDASAHIGDAIVFFFLGKILIFHYGSDLLPVMSAVLALLGVTSVSSGLAVAAQPVVSVYYGERNYKAVRAVMRTVIGYTVTLGLGLTAFAAAFPELVLAAVGIDEPALMGVGRIAVRLTAIGCVPAMLANVMNNYYQYIDYDGLAVGFSVWAWMALPLVFVALFGGAGERTVWLWFPASFLASVLSFAVYLRLLFGRELFPLLLPHDRDRQISVFNLFLDENEIVAVSQLVATRLEVAGVDRRRCLRAQLIVEEVLMAVIDHNSGRRVRAEVTVDLNDGIMLTMRDDGDIFDITDSNAKVSSLRAYMVASVMRSQRRLNFTTTGFNRNVFRL